ncbi:MAG: zinc ABC transporter substrate-binding protein [Thermodesulfobacteriota bacterium]|nr:zinc ABC transporter substrate-binding protein [Thermodesulfobacteriota bacterium]
MLIVKNILKTVLYFILMSVILQGIVHAKAEDKISLFVSIAPQAYFAQRIGGEKVIVNVLVPQGKSPATYAPKPEQMVKLAKAELFFSIGVPFESSLIPKIRRFSNNLKVIDTKKGIKLRKFANGGTDPHIWMSPKLVAKQAQTMCNALSIHHPRSKLFFKENLDSFLKDLHHLDENIKKTLAPVRGETILVFHPVFGYFSDAYNLKQMAVEKSGNTPKGKNLVAFIKQARQNSVHVIFVQPQFDTRSADKIASAINGVVIPLDPLAKDYIANLQEMALKIRNAFKKK